MNRMVGRAVHCAPTAATTISCSAKDGAHPSSVAPMPNADTNPALLRRVDGVTRPSSINRFIAPMLSSTLSIFWRGVGQQLSERVGHNERMLFNQSSDLVGWVQTFAPLFSVRVWPFAQALLLGAIMAPGKRTVSSVLRVLGLEGVIHFQNYHRVLNRAQWSALG